MLAIEETARQQARKILSSEHDLRTFQYIAVEVIVTDVTSAVSKIADVREQLNLGDEITFESHANRLNDGDEDVQARQQDPRTPQPRAARYPKPTYADGFCVWSHLDGEKRLLFALEYKPPHKLTSEMLWTGLQEMNVLDQVVNRSTIPTDKVGHFGGASGGSSAGADLQVDVGRGNGIQLFGHGPVLRLSPPGSEMASNTLLLPFRSER